MKKVLFLLLFLLVLGAASISAQVRIGGDGEPNDAAVLDLNANNDATPAENKGGLALPRVELASTTALLNGATPLSGTLVYNTNADVTGGVGIGVYIWTGTSWVAVDYAWPGETPYMVAGPFALPSIELAYNTETFVAITGLRNNYRCWIGSEVPTIVTPYYNGAILRTLRYPGWNPAGYLLQCRY